MHLGALLAIAGGLLLAACTAGPDYRRPDTPMPPAWKLEAPWRASDPADAEFKGNWWLRFRDPGLNVLVHSALENNPSLAIASARLTQARAVLTGASANLFPQVSAGERAARSKISANRPLVRYDSPNFSTAQNDLLIALSVNYEADFAGRVRRMIEGAQAGAQQAEADFQNTRLMLLADLATNYFALRGIDAELDVLDRSIELQRRALALVDARHTLGAATGLDLAQQQALLDATLVQVETLRRQRGPFEHALATLTGTPAPSFTLAPDLRPMIPPQVPLGVPSDILERRPDIASAERAMAAANAQIGLAASAYYPSVMLGAALGTDSRNFGALLNTPSMIWSLGMSAAQTLFDGGRIDASVEAARAGHAGAAAAYRRVTLIAMQEVEDGITGLSILERASVQSSIALGSARRVLAMSTARYEAGATTYFEVIAAQQSLLTSERQSVQLAGQRMLTTVFLVKALGGDWERPARAAPALASTSATATVSAPR